MDGPLNVGRRDVSRSFEYNRHSSSMLARAFERLSGASSAGRADSSSVQIRQKKVLEKRQTQEARR